MKQLQIASTDKYDSFKEHGEQPQLNAGHVKKLMASMSKNGFIAAKPIHVYRDGAHFRIIDGHNRFYAARALKIPVFYVVGEKAESSVIADVNTAARVWPLSAFVNMYVKRGIKDYIKLANYAAQGINLARAASMLVGEAAGSYNVGETIRKGAFKIKTTYIIDEVLRIRKAIAPHAPLIADGVFTHALSVLLQLKGFDPDVLIRRLEMNPRMLEKCATKDQAFDLLEAIYNYRSQDKANIAFQAREYIRQNTVAKNKAA